LKGTESAFFTTIIIKSEAPEDSVDGKRPEASRDTIELARALGVPALSAMFVEKGLPRRWVFPTMMLIEYCPWTVSKNETS
jgi:hypothetical protein